MACHLAGPVRSRPAQILVDDQHLRGRPPQRRGAFDEAVLQPRRHAVVNNLLTGRLPDINDRQSIAVPTLNLLAAALGQQHRTHRPLIGPGAVAVRSSSMLRVRTASRRLVSGNAAHSPASGLPVRRAGNRRRTYSFRSYALYLRYDAFSDGAPVTRFELRPYQPGDGPAVGSVPVSVIVLARNESANIDRCLASVTWAAQVLVIDSGSTDDTVRRAAAQGAEVIEESWRGYGAQREFALRLPVLRHDWVYFVDADEWISPELALEVADVLLAGGYNAFAQRGRLVFQGRWIRHCGWYRGSWNVHLMQRSSAAFGPDPFGERARINGSIGRLRNDIVDEDRKGLVTWLYKHVRYAELEAGSQDTPLPLAARWQAFRPRRALDSRPLARAIAKDLLLPLVPARPVSLFLYMYVLRLGFLDGLIGLRFCLYHAWFQLTIGALREELRHGHQVAEQVRYEDLCADGDEKPLLVAAVIGRD